MTPAMEEKLGAWVHGTYLRRVERADIHEAIESYCRDREALRRFDIHDSNEPFHRGSLNDDQAAIFSLATTSPDDDWTIVDQGLEFAIEWAGVSILFHGELKCNAPGQAFTCVFHYDVDRLRDFRFAVETFTGDEEALERFLVRHPTP